jgi:phosphoribosylformylglycinamidine cyclo-ligase
MATYKQAGVNISMGDKCSELAYAAAKKTFASRKGMIGVPVNIEGGFTGALDFGKFYVVFNCDGVGSKMLVGLAMNKLDTLGYDLLAMVADDAVCVGAETVSITNTIDTEKVTDKVIGPMMDGLKKACMEQKVVIPGGEIGEMPDMVTGTLWNASAIGIVEKNKFILGKDVKPGDKIIGLRSRGFRSNGFALVRYILEKNFGGNWVKKRFNAKKNWGEAVLAPSIIYSDAVLELLGRFGKKRKCNIKAIAHITGGGLPGNLPRVLGNYGATLDNIWPAGEPMVGLQKIGQVSDREAYEVWNMGTGMALISDEFKKISGVMKKHGIEARIIGEVTKQKGVRLISQGYFDKGKLLHFD